MKTEKEIVEEINRLNNEKIEILAKFNKYFPEEKHNLYRDKINRNFNSKIDILRWVLQSK